MLIKKKRKKKISILAKRLGPYHLARFDALSKKVSLSLMVMAQGGDSKLAYEVQNIPGHKWARHFLNSTSSQGAEIRNWLESTSPDAVLIPGWSQTIALESLDWCLKNKVPAVLMSESTELDRPRKPIVEFIKSRIVGLFSSAFVGGKSSADYLIKLGFDGSMHPGYDVVDNEHFEKRAGYYRYHSAKFKKKFNLPSKYFLCVCRLAPEKNIATILRALSMAFQKGLSKDFSLVVAGDGPLKDDLEKISEKLRIRDRILFLGKVGYEDMPGIYSLASAFILSSYSEPWGLVVNESLASGTPVLVSNICGCVSDLIIEGETGMTFAPNDVEKLAALMIEISRNGVLREKMGKKGSRQVSDWGPENFANGAFCSIESAMTAPVKKANFLDETLLGLWKKYGN
jgi:glycosyltransferase involved in cell wall biosynthesis